MSRVTTGSLPKYRQLLNILRSEIISGKLPPDERLPTEDQLGKQYGLSRGTVRKAIEQLEAERLIRTEQGIGSFVASSHANAIPFHFGEVGPGEHATYEVLEQKVLPASLEVAERLMIAPGERVIHVARRRKSGERITGYTERYLAEALCPALVDADLSVQSVHQVLVSASMLPLLRAEYQIEAHVLPADDAELLRAEPGVRAIVVTRMTFTAPNRPAVWYRGIFRDMYSIDVRLDEADE